MGVKLTVIGSSPAWPNPGSAHAGYIVESDGGRLLLDCGPGVLSRLRTNGLVEVEAIAITHFHLDHWGDLVPWAWFAAHGSGPAGKPRLWLPPGGQAELTAFSARWGSPEMFSRSFELAEYEPGTPFRAAGFDVEARPVEHYDLAAYGFRVRDGEGRLLAYSGDSAPCGGLRDLAAGADLFLCEATLASSEHDATPRGHMAADEAAAVGNARLLITHRPAELETPPGVERASDGLVVSV
jgi:ribonuclease BN (tRNA processing enzyme)